MDARRNAVFRALADETRREILGLLGNGAMTSGDIANHFDSSWPTISRHLAVLRDAGLVTGERSGQEIRYEVNTSIFEDLVKHVMKWTKRPRQPRAARTRRTRETEV